MTDREKADRIMDLLEEQYPLAECSLDYEHGWQLMVSVRLSAQCTDARVNIVTKELFSKYPTPQALAAAPVEEIEKIVKPCGLGHTKAKDISAAMRILCSEYGGIVPDDLDTLLNLPGVGRKSANLLVGDIYGKPAVVTDTHCIRICGKLGLTEGKDPYKVEMKLRDVIDMSRGNDFCHRLVLFGREICTARNPKCDQCRLKELCSAYIGEHTE